MLLNDSKEMEKRSVIYRQEIDVHDHNDSKVICYNYVENGTTVLDVGCACGDLGIILHKLKNCKVYGMEYNSGSIAVAKAAQAYEELYQVDLNNFDSGLYAELEGKFDYIILADVLEHLAEPRIVLKQLKFFLKEKGRMIVSLPNVAHASVKAGLLLDRFDYADVGVLDRTHVSFYTKNSLAGFFADCRIEVLKVKTTYRDPQGVGEENLLNYLPGKVARYIMKDCHSLVWQYVMLMKNSDMADERLKAHNQKIFDLLDAGDFYKKQAQKLLKSYSKNKFKCIKLKMKLFIFSYICRSEKKKDKCLKKIKELKCRC